MPREGPMKLEQGTISGVSIRNQYHVREVLAQQVGISDWDHDEHSVHHEAWLTHFVELNEALAREGFPGAKSGNLSRRNLWARYRLTIVRALCKSCYESLACRLTRRARCEEKLHQPLRCWEIGIVDLFQLRFFHVHDVLATFRGGANQQHSADKRRSLQRYLLSDHAAERETKQIHVCEAERIHESGACAAIPGTLAATSPVGRPQIGTLEQNDFAPRRQRVGNCRIPVIQCT